MVIKEEILGQDRKCLQTKKKERVKECKWCFPLQTNFFFNIHASKDIN